MKNRKGFTLIELIAVIVILGLVLIIAIPFFSGSLKTFRDDYYTNLNGNMLNAGKEFFNDNRLYLPHKYLDSSIVDANTLNEEKIIDELRDYNGNKCEKYDSYVIAIRKSADEITYDTCIKCLDDNYDNFDEKEACSLAWKEGEGFSEVIFDKPEPVYIYKGTSRSELKKLVITYPDIRRCLGKAGVCEQEIMRVSGKGENGVNPVYPINLDTVNPNKIGTYNIKYKYESYGTYVDGKVIVFENKAPTVNITKTNKVKTGTITNTDVAKTSSYDKNPSNRDDWAQQLNFTFSYTFGEDAKPGLYVTKYQIFFNNRWEDYCTPNKGTNKCTKTELREMDETVRFRMIDSEGHISTFTENMGLRIDRTKPSCQLRTDGTYGLRQWYVTDVKISFQSKDDNYGTKPFPNANPIKSGELFSGITLSQIKSNTYDTQKTDTNWITWYGYIEDKANNYEICNISFKRDATAPKCEFTIPKADGDDGWHKMSIVTVSFKTHTDTSGQPDYSGVEDYGFNSWDSQVKVVNHTEDSPSVTYHGEIQDMAGNKSTCDISFIKDSTPPTCTAKVPAPDGDEDGGSKWHKMPTVKVEINTIGDNLSGVRDYGLNSWNSGTKFYNHTQDTAGITYTYQIRDIAGNMSTCSVWFKKDSTNPECAVYTTGTNGNNEWYKMGTVNGAFSSTTDNLSGVRTYGFDSNTGNHTKSTTTSTAGTTWTGYIKDKAGNTNSCTTWFKFDNIAPTCTSSGGSTWINKDVTIYGTCADTGYSGCKENISKTYSAEINSSTETPGTVYDNAGNSVLCPQNRTVQIDKTDPTCVTTGEQGKWVNYNVTLTGTCSDPNGATHSGCAGNTSATFSSNTNENKTSGNVCDNAGNCITCPYKLVQIDKTAPTCSSSSSPSGWTNGKVTVSGTCSDTGGSGCKSNTSVTRSGQQNTTVSPGTVYDNAGNSVTCPNSAVKIDTTAPTCTTTTTSSGWTNQQVTLTGVCSDTGGSGCKGNSSASFADEQARAHAPANVVDNAGNEAQCNYVNVYIDRTLPTCSVRKSNTGTTSGVTTSVAASDSGGSGLNVSASNSGETGVKSSKTYYVKDYAGNTGSCSVTVTSSDCNCSDCHTGSNTCKGGYDTYNIGCTSGCAAGYTHMGNGSANTNGTTCYCQKYNSCKTGSNTCKYGCDKCYS